MLFRSRDARQIREASADFREAPKKLQRTVTDLERRGLLQWDGSERAYGLHPVVRAVAAAGMAAADLEHHGQRVLDFFTALPHRPYAEAETLEDVSSGVQVVRTLLKLGRYEEAARLYSVELSSPLINNLEAYALALELYSGFFPRGWLKPPEGVGKIIHLRLQHTVGILLGYLGEYDASLRIISSVIRFQLESMPTRALDLSTRICHLAISSDQVNRHSVASRLRAFAWETSIYLLRTLHVFDGNGIFEQQLDFFIEQTRHGKWEEAAAT